MSLSEDEPVDYSAYISYQTGCLQVYALYSGFMLTAMILLLTMLPDPTQMFIQITLFIFAMLLESYGLWMSNIAHLLIRCVKVAPQLPQTKMAYWNVMLLITNHGLKLVIVLIFLVWNLVYLALTTAIATVILEVISYMIQRPFVKWYSEKWIRK